MHAVQYADKIFCCQEWIQEISNQIFMFVISRSAYWNILFWNVFVYSVSMDILSIAKETMAA